MADPPIACTLRSDEVGPRVDRWRALMANLIDQRVIEGGRRLRFPHDEALAAEVALLAASEHACCAFLDFTVRIVDDRVLLDVRAPEGAVDVLDGLFGTAV